jgi:hypothetical protein
MSRVKYPSLYQINTRVWLTQFSQALGRTVTRDGDELASLGLFVDLPAWQGHVFEVVKQA